MLIPTEVRAMYSEMEFLLVLAIVSSFVTLESIPSIPLSVPQM